MYSFFIYAGSQRAELMMMKQVLQEELASDDYRAMELYNVEWMKKLKGHETALSDIAKRIQEME